jgi:hypothetical protein
MPKINFASSMLVEDHLKKVLAKTTGKPWKLTNNKLLPKSQHSPFGDFPPEYMKKPSNVVEPVPKIEAAEQSIAAKGHCKYCDNCFAFLIINVAILKKGEGLGGKTTSLLEPKEKPVVQKPIAGATKRRPIVSSEFRRFYDRGDLPISIEHGP